MRVSIDGEKCLGYALCVAAAPEVFDLRNEQAVLKGDAISPDSEAAVEIAAEECPTQAIAVRSDR